MNSIKFIWNAVNFLVYNFRRFQMLYIPFTDFRFKYLIETNQFDGYQQFFNFEMGLNGQPSNNTTLPAKTRCSIPI